MGEAFLRLLAEVSGGTFASRSGESKAAEARRQAAEAAQQLEAARQLEAAKAPAAAPDAAGQKSDGPAQVPKGGDAAGQKSGGAGQPRKEGDTPNGGTGKSADAVPKPSPPESPPRDAPVSPFGQPPEDGGGTPDTKKPGSR